jgi:hypothetical protein
VVAAAGSTGSWITPPASVFSSDGDPADDAEVGSVVVGASLGEGVFNGFLVRLGCAVGWAVAGAVGVADAVGVGVGSGEVGLVAVGLGEGVGVGWAGAPVRGRTAPAGSSQTMARYPPAGIVSEPAPSEE